MLLVLILFFLVYFCYFVRLMNPLPTTTHGRANVQHPFRAPPPHPFTCGTQFPIAKDCSRIHKRKLCMPPPNPIHDPIDFEMVKKQIGQVMSSHNNGEDVEEWNQNN